MHHFDHHADWMNLSGSRRMTNGAAHGRPLHRIAEVMEQERIGFRLAAKRMNRTESKIRHETLPHADLKLSDLYRWQSALDVPVADLLREPDMGLSPQVQFRGRLLKAMRTLRSIQEQVCDESIHILSMQLAQQLTELMPELTQVSAWPTVGKQRTRNEMGAIAEKLLPDDFFDRSLDA